MRRRPVGRRPGLLLREASELLLGRSRVFCLVLCLGQPCPLLAGLVRSDVSRKCGLRGSKTRDAARRKETPACGSDQRSRGAQRCNQILSAAAGLNKRNGSRSAEPWSMLDITSTSTTSSSSSITTNPLRDGDAHVMT